MRCQVITSWTHYEHFQDAESAGESPSVLLLGRFGILYMRVTNPPEYRCVNKKEGGDCLPGFFLFTDAVSFAPFGALIGMFLFAEDRWEPASLPVSAGISAPGGKRLALSFEFGK